MMCLFCFAPLRFEESEPFNKVSEKKNGKEKRVEN